MCKQREHKQRGVCGSQGCGAGPGARPKAQAPRLTAHLALVASGIPSGARELQGVLPQTHRAAGLSPAPQTLAAEKRFEEPLLTPGFS